MEVTASDGNPGRPFPPSARAGSTVHRTWDSTTVAMARCDYCQLPSRGIVQKCKTCKLCICKECFDKGRLDTNRNHVIDKENVSWVPVPKQKSNKKGSLGRAVLQAAGNRVTKKKAYRVVEAHHGLKRKHSSPDQQLAITQSINSSATPYSSPPDYQKSASLLSNLPRPPLPPREHDKPARLPNHYPLNHEQSRLENTSRLLPISQPTVSQFEDRGRTTSESPRQSFDQHRINSLLATLSPRTEALSPFVRTEVLPSATAHRTSDWTTTFSRSQGKSPNEIHAASDEWPRNEHLNSLARYLVDNATLLQRLHSGNIALDQCLCAEMAAEWSTGKLRIIFPDTCKAYRFMLGATFVACHHLRLGPDNNAAKNWLDEQESILLQQGRPPILDFPTESFLLKHKDEWRHSLEDPPFYS